MQSVNNVLLSLIYLEGLCTENALSHKHEDQIGLFFQFSLTHGTNIFFQGDIKVNRKFTSKFILHDSPLPGCRSIQDGEREGKDKKGVALHKNHYFYRGEEDSLV
jgi:hypothetical protein